MKSSSLNHAQQGSSMIEVLVAVVVLSIGLLGVASLQSIGLKNNTNAYLRTQANVLANDMLDRMRVNSEIALNGGYSVAVGDASGGSGTIAQSDIDAWKEALAANLPGGDGSVDNCSGGSCTVVVQWNDALDNGTFFTADLTLETRL